MNEEILNQQVEQVAQRAPKKSGDDKLVIILGLTIIIFTFLLSYLVYATFKKARESTTTQAPVAAPTLIPSPTISFEEAAKKEVEKLETVSASDETQALEKDIEASDFSTLDSELNLLEAEL